MGRTKGGKTGPGNPKFDETGHGPNNTKREPWLARLVTAPGEPNEDTVLSVRENRARRKFKQLFRQSSGRLVLVAPESFRMQLAREQRKRDKEKGLVPPRKAHDPKGPVPDELIDIYRDQLARGMQARHEFGIE